MISQSLREARKYEEEKEKSITREERPQFHLSTRVGWMNDPNGFCYYNGEYHLFYQYHPYDSHWGSMHWGHAVSRDLLHWEYLPAALAPDMPYDRDGCFSGSAIELEDGRQMLMYTGVRKEEQPDGSLREIQTQCIAVGDGTDYEKYEGNPVLDAEDLPEGSCKFDFRDPKIWRKEDGSYQCIIGNCTEERDGRILLYSSEDGYHWKYEKVLAENKGRYGQMWECPDFFELDGKQVLLISPQGMLPRGLEYHNGNGTVCLIGTYDKETETFTEERNQAIDYGIDFYAPQTILTPEGRRIMIGWMQCWSTSKLHSPNQPWFGQMNLPRELSIKDGRLIQNPICELESLRCNGIRYENIDFEDDCICLEGIEGRTIDMELSVRPGNEAELYRKFTVRFAQDENYYTAFHFYPKESIVKIDRRFAGSREDVIHERRCYVRCGDGRLKIRIILDRYSAEIFVNDGEQALSVTMETAQEADGISFATEGSVVMDIVKYDLCME